MKLFEIDELIITARDGSIAVLRTMVPIYLNFHIYDLGMTNTTAYHIVRRQQPHIVAEFTIVYGICAALWLQLI